MVRMAMPFRNRGPNLHNRIAQGVACSRGTGAERPCIADDPPRIDYGFDNDASGS
jgi:hypothetical protein